MKKLISILSILTIASPSFLTISCNTNKDDNSINESITDDTKPKPELKKSLELDKITAEMVLNWQDEYIVKMDNGEIKTLTPDRLNELYNSTIKRIIEKI